MQDAQSLLAWELCRTFLADREGRIAVFRAFLDESGTHAGSAVLTVAGYMGRPAGWRAFVPKWKQTLKPIKVFHSTDCNGFHGEFEGWSKEDRDNKVKRLLPLLPAMEGRGLAIGIVLRDLEEAFQGREHLRRYLGSPYEACLQWWIHSMVDLMYKRGSREPLAIVHEQNQYATEALRAYEWVKRYHDPANLLMSFSFGSKEQFVPLQAADILAYDVGKRLANIAGKPRKSFEALTPEGFEPWIRFYDKANMSFLLSTLEMAKFLEESERMEVSCV